jgi:hypothetical protein
MLRKLKNFGIFFNICQKYKKENKMWFYYYQNLQTR